MAKEEKEVVKEEKKERFQLVEVPTQTAIVVKDTKKDVLLENQTVLAEILNKLEKIEKSVA